MSSGMAARAEVVIQAPPEVAFQLFTSEIGLWWRRDTPYWNDHERGVSLRIEPFVDGRFIEVHDLDTGSGLEVGRVTTWAPGERFAMTWTQVGWPEGVFTDIEVTFTPVENATLVRLRQTGFEQVPDARGSVAGYEHGWTEVLGWFAAHADQRHRRSTPPRKGLPS